MGGDPGAEGGSAAKHGETGSTGLARNAAGVPVGGGRAARLGTASRVSRRPRRGCRLARGGIAERPVNSVTPTAEDGFAMVAGSKPRNISPDPVREDHRSTCEAAAPVERRP